MTVDPTTTAPAATLTYTVRVRNTGVLPATNLLLRAGVPGSGRYVPGSTLLDGRPIADLGDAPPVTEGVNLGLLAPNTTALLTFQVALQRASIGAAITNSATARSDQLGTHVSDTVTTRVN
jgi:large repetitive protein